MQTALHGHDSLCQPRVFPSPGYDKLYPKGSTEEGLYLAAIRNQEGKEGTEEGLVAIRNQDGKDARVEGMGMATAKEQDIFYSPLGEPDLRDLPSFAYQISQGMVCATIYNDMHLESYSLHCPPNPVRSTSPPWGSSTVT